MYLTIHGDYYLSELTPEERDRFQSGYLVVREQEQSGSNLCAVFHPVGYVRENLARPSWLWITLPERQGRVCARYLLVEEVCLNDEACIEFVGGVVGQDLRNCLRHRIWRLRLPDAGRKRIKLTFPRSRLKLIEKRLQNIRRTRSKTLARMSSRRRGQSLK